MNGLAVVYAARKLGIKSVYEVRGLWEVTRMSRQPEWEGSEHYNMIRNLEAQAAKGADAVLSITNALKEEMISRGVPAEKITVVSNGVHVDRFQPLQKDTNLANELGIANKTVIGFIGSFVQYEGLEYIVDAVEILVNQGYKDIVALMVGDGAVADEVRQRVTDKNLDDYFIFTGRIPHEEVEGYYSLVDIAPLPRKGLPVCEMVSPLKPFEAMAMGKVVLASNVAALSEIVQDGYNGVLFEKDNIKDLASKLEMLINDSTLRKRIGKQAREWVERERDWKHLSKKVIEVYKGLL
jgi:glycosyltransferase involved in cell wall biosynthesis